MILPQIRWTLARIVVVISFAWTGLGCQQEQAGQSSGPEWSELAPTLIGTYYTGATWAPDFWGRLDLARADSDLGEIRRYGFNTVVLVVPWVGFQPTIDPIAHDERRFALLDEMFSAAERHGLRVLLRVGYAHDNAAKPDLAHLDRAVSFFENPAARSAWRAFLRRVQELTSRHDNFEFAFLTWEDFWFLDLAHRPRESRLTLAARSGWQDYLRDHSLAALGSLYGESFGDYTEVPIPPPRSPATRLFSEFWDQWLLRLLYKSREVFPNLTLEVRVDCDPAEVGGEAICHDSTFDLGGAEAPTVVYYSPAWGAPNRGDQSTAEVALGRLRLLLERVRAHTDNPIFIDQFNFIDNTPGFERMTAIAAEHLPAFLKGAAELIEEETRGYALWTLRDVFANYLPNGSFEHGLGRWVVEKGERVRDAVSGQQRLRLDPGGSLTRHNEGPGLPHASRFSFTLSLNAVPAGDEDPLLSVRFVDPEDRLAFERERIRIAEDFGTVTLRGIKLVGDESLTIANEGGPVLLDDLLLYNFVQENGILDTDGRPKKFSRALVAANSNISAKRYALAYYDTEPLRSAELEGIYADGWVGRVFKVPVLVPQDLERPTLSVKIHVPNSWHGYRNRVSVRLDGIELASFDVQVGSRELRFPLGEHWRQGQVYELVLSARNTHVPTEFEPTSRDRRELSFRLLGIGFRVP